MRGFTDIKSMHQQFNEEPYFASSDDVIEAFEALSKDEVVKLKNYAQKRSFKTGFYGDENYSADALLNDAFIALLSGSKKWKPKEFSFYWAMWWAIKNISHNKIQHLKSEVGDIEYKLVQYEPGENNDIDQYLKTTQVESSYYVDARIRIDTLKEYFVNDKKVLDLIDAQLNDFNGEETKEYLEVDQTQLETIQRRLTRGIDKVFEKGQI